MVKKSADEILVITSIEGKTTGQKPQRGLSKSLLKGTMSSISVNVLKENVEGFFGQLREILHSGSGQIGGFEVDQVEVSAQIRGDGKVALMGSGVELGMQGGIKFVLKRVS